MADFHIYPDPSTAPLDVSAGGTSAAIPIEELHAVGASTLEEMYIRILCIGAALPSGVHPSVVLQCNSGLEVVESLDPDPQQFSSVFGDASGSVYVGAAKLELVSANVYRVSFFLDSTGNNWSIKIKNNDSVSRKFTFVVGKTDADTQKPWIHVNETLNFGQSLPGEAVTLARTVNNWGTGPLTVTDAPGPIGSSAFSLATAPGTIAPNGSGDVQITFTPPTAPGQSSTTFSITSDDAGALGSGTQHNRSIALTGTTSQLEIMMLLDASGSMSWKPDGPHDPSNPNTPWPVPDQQRWGLMRTALDQFFDLLDDFDGKGKFGIATFPDPSQPASGNPPPTSRVIFNVTQINTANVNDGKQAIATTTPTFAGTPMGHGLATAMGTTPNNHGMFANDTASRDHNRRFIVLLSDGAHNIPPSGSPRPSDFYQAGAGTADGFHTKKIGVIAVAYGAVGASDVDKTTLNTLVTESLESVSLASGVTAADAFVDAVADDSGLPIQKAFRRIVLKPLALYSEVDPGGSLTVARPEARHSITVTPHDKKVAFVVSFDVNDGLEADLHTPTCELITAASAARFGVTFHKHRRYLIYTVPEAFLKPKAGQPRFGTWTLILRRQPVQTSAAVRYEYEAITKSGIRLFVGTQAVKHHAGDPIRLVAELSADGIPIRNASVTCHTTKPLDSVDKWSARTPVSKEALEATVKKYGGTVEVSAKQLRVEALESMGLAFAPIFARATIPMSESAEQPGSYVGTIDTSTAGTHDFYIVATGQTAQGVQFRREAQVQVFVGVRPRPDFTRFIFTYHRFIEEGRPWIEATVRFSPRDQFGNVLLVDPATDPTLQLVARGGKPLGPIVALGDGSYEQVVRFSADAAPTFGLRVGDEDVIRGYEVPQFDALSFADEVVAFTKGREAVAGANKHADAKLALGDPTTKGEDQFVSLGARGSITLGMGDKIISAREVTVFVRPDEQLRSYAVEVLPLVWPRDWVRVGESKGETKTFSLQLEAPPRNPKGDSYLEVEGSVLGADFSFDVHGSFKHVKDWFGWGKLGLKGIKAVRIVDTSDSTRTSDFRVSETPGVSILGVGFSR